LIVEKLLEEKRELLIESIADKEAYRDLVKYILDLYEELKYTHPILAGRIFNKLGIIMEQREKTLLDSL
jgi:hypothetical protein